MATYFLTPFISSFLLCCIIVYTQRFHSSYTADGDFGGVQKFHSKPTPRVGGLAVICSYLISSVYFWTEKVPFTKDQLILCGAIIAPFLIGFAEDLRKGISARQRLAYLVVASLFAIWLLGLAIHSVGVPLIDRLFLEFPMLAILFTCFALAGMANAINIIDGFNGLAAFVSITIALSLSYVAFTLNDQFVGLNSLILAGALAGFAVLNYPFGRIFLGDGGAYITGFALGILSIMLVENNKQVSAWFPILLFFYPIFETLFSFYRKRFIRGIPAMEPDGAHLHMLVYGRMVPRTSTLPVIGSWTKNSRTMPYLWIFSATCNILSVQFISSDTLLLVSIFCSIGAYIYFYRKLVHWGRVTKK